MKIIGWMLTRMILLRFAFILIGISIFVVTLDIVAYSPEILDLRAGNLDIILEYAGLRAPSILSTFLPLSVLLALLLTLTELSYRNEIPAIWSTGVSPTRLMIMLVPLSIIKMSVVAGVILEVPPIPVTVVDQLFAALQLPPVTGCQ